MIYGLVNGIVYGSVYCEYGIMYGRYGVWYGVCMVWDIAWRVVWCDAVRCVRLDCFRLLCPK